MRWFDLPSLGGVASGPRRRLTAIPTAADVVVVAVVVVVGWFVGLKTMVALACIVFPWTFFFLYIIFVQWGV